MQSTLGLPTPGFHHLHLNSVDPDAAIDFYVRQFPSTKKGRWGRHPALFSPNDVMILFDKVEAPPPTSPQSAIWHFGWHVADAQATVRSFRERPDVVMRPLYTSEEGESVLISSDTWPGEAGALGRTKAEIIEARARNIQPTRKGGFAYMSGGPEDALFEIAGDYPSERFNHVHMWHEHPFCALLWYKTHLNAPVRAGFSDTDLTETNCQVPRGEDQTWPALNREGMFRTPRAGVEFGDVVLTWYANQGRRASRFEPRPDAGPYRSVRRRSRRLDRQAEARGGQVSRRPVPAGRRPGRDDRRPQPRGDRTRRDPVIPQPWHPTKDRWNLRRSPPVVSSG